MWCIICTAYTILFLGSSTDSLISVLDHDSYESPLSSDEEKIIETETKHVKIKDSKNGENNEKIERRER